MTEIPTTETPAQARLREARARLAALDADLGDRGPALNEPSSSIRLPQPGEQVHALASGLTLHRGGGWGSGVVLTRGQTFVVTAEMVQANFDNLGQPVAVNLVHAPDLQLAQYGRVLYSPGAAPETMEPWTYGSTDWAEARETARREAWARPTAHERAEALAAVQARFGDAPSTTTMLNGAPNPSIREAEEQARQIAARGVVHREHVVAREAGAER